MIVQRKGQEHERSDSSKNTGGTCASSVRQRTHMPPAPAAAAPNIASTFRDKARYFCNGSPTPLAHLLSRLLSLFLPTEEEEEEERSLIKDLKRYAQLAVA